MLKLLKLHKLWLCNYLVPNSLYQSFTRLCLMYFPPTVTQFHGTGTANQYGPISPADAVLISHVGGSGSPAEPKPL